VSLSFVRKFRPAVPQASSPAGKRLTSAAFWSLMGEAGSRGLSFLGAIVTARTLGLREFGALALIQGTLAAFMTFAAFGMGQTTTRYIAACRVNNPERIAALSSLSLLFSCFSGLLFAGLWFAVGPFIATYMLKAPELASIVRCAAPILLSNAVTGAATGTIIGFEAFERLAKISWTSSLLNLIFLTVSVPVWGLAGGVSTLVASDFVRSILAIRLAHIVMSENGHRLLKVSGLNEVRILWQFSLPSMLSGALHVPVSVVCQMIIARQSDGSAQLGIYDAGQKLMTLVTFVPVAASAIIGPFLSSLSGPGHAASHRNATLTVALVQIASCAGPALVVALMAPTAMDIFGETFVAGSAVATWVMVLAPISMAMRLFWQALLSVGRAWTSLFLWMLWAAVAVALTLRWQAEGALGLAQAMLSAYSSTLVGYVYFMMKVWHRAAYPNETFG
jgi:O-antigen/teichoic acid export membrane protein